MQNIQNLTNYELLNKIESTKNNIARLHNEQLVKKVHLNSAYGSLGNAYFRYYDIRLAEAITVSCKLVIQWAELRVNEFINKLCDTKDVNYVIMVDTDALYLNFDPLVKKLKLDAQPTEKIVDFLDKFCAEKLQPKLNKIYTDLFEYTNAFEMHMNMKRENIAESCVVVAKKRYAMSVWDSEGVKYKTPKTKITGIEAVRSSTPEFCRTKIKKALDIVLNGTQEELQQYLDAVREEFNTLQVSQVSFPRGINDLNKYASGSSIYIKGTPIHVKGALLYNNLIKEMKLTKKYPEIRDGDKIRFVYLKKPNTIKDTVISFPDELPPEFGLEEYVDFTMQFEKTLLDPIQNIVQEIGWSATHVSSLEAFF